MYMVSLFLELVALALYTAYYAIYAQQGASDEVKRSPPRVCCELELYDSQALKLSGRGLEALSTLIFLLLLILLAKGYTVTR